MSQFLDAFPLIRYDIDKNPITENKTVTDIFLRVGFIREIIGNISAYTEYIIKNGETPELLAERFYGNPQAHWIILYANDIFDPHYDWPLTSFAFQRYIVKKYRDDFKTALNLDDDESAPARAVIAWTQTTAHSYEKVVTTVNMPKLTGVQAKDYVVDGDEAYRVKDGEFVGDPVTTIRRYQIDKEPISSANPIGSDYKYETYQANTAFPLLSTDLPASTYRTYKFRGRLLKETITTEMKSLYDYEVEMNEKRRTIKIIKPAYYPRIMKEFEDITGNFKNKKILRKLS